MPHPSRQAIKVVQEILGHPSGGPHREHTSVYPEISLLRLMQRPPSRLADDAMPDLCLLPGEQAPLDDDPDYRYAAFVTNTVGGQVQFHDARHRTLQLAALAVTLTARLRHIALDGELAKASPKNLRFRVFAVPARYVTHARRRILKIPERWPWATDLTTAWDRLQALTPT